MMRPLPLSSRYSICSVAIALALLAAGHRVGASASTPYGGTPLALPGTIHAANFDEGGPGVAYGDSSAGNTGGAYRQTDVDIEASSEGDFDIGWIAPGEWANYTVSVPAAGSYTATLRVASPSGGGALHVGFNGPSNVWKTVSVPATGGWQNWTNVSLPVTLGGGTQQLTLLFDTGGFNVESIQVSGGASAPNSGPYTGTPAGLPGALSAANFDFGPNGTAYSDTTSGNSGGAYRQTDVDLEPSADGGYNVGWIASGEWLNYTVNVARAGTYTVTVRVASPSGGGTFHVGFNGSSNVWTAVPIPATGGWQNWTTVTTTATLGAGQQQLTLYADTSGFNLGTVTVAAGPSQTGIPSLSHVYVIIFENKEASSIIGRSDAPYLNSLASQYGLSQAYSGITHPSLPNYMALTSGNTYFTDDCIGCSVDVWNIADSVEQAGRSWKGYMEDMPQACGTTDTGLYVTKHNPFVHYADIVSNASRCRARVVPFTSFGADVASGAIPNFVWITPNLCNDMHDCDVATGDRWLSGVVPQILGTADFANSVLFITWDEGTSSVNGGGQVPLIVVSPRTSRVQSALPANHYDLLRTIADALRVTAPGQAAGARPLTEFFQ